MYNTCNTQLYNIFIYYNNKSHEKYIQYNGTIESILERGRIILKNN